MSGKQGLQECESLLIRHMTESLLGEEQSNCGYMIDQAGHDEQAEDFSYTLCNLTSFTVGACQVRARVIFYLVSMCDIN